jgi:hypothetical protein
MAGGEGFEPSTPNLGGWCSLRPKPVDNGLGIRTELLAHDLVNNQNSILNINTLLKIEKVAIYLEGKGKSAVPCNS